MRESISKYTTPTLSSYQMTWLGWMDRIERKKSFFFVHIPLVRFDDQMMMFLIGLVVFWLFSLIFHFPNHSSTWRKKNFFFFSLCWYDGRDRLLLLRRRRYIWPHVEWPFFIHPSIQGLFIHSFTNSVHFYCVCSFFFWTKFNDYALVTSFFFSVNLKDDLSSVCDWESWTRGKNYTQSCRRRRRCHGSFQYSHLHLLSLFYAVDFLVINNNHMLSKHRKNWQTRKIIIKKLWISSHHL